MAKGVVILKNLVSCALMPHPPIMIPDVGKHELHTIKDTVAAAEHVSQVIKELNPQTVVLITPHGPVFEDAACISIHPRLKGNFAAFGAPETGMGFETDGLLVRHILRKAERLGVHVVELTEHLAKTYRLSLQLDHGALVPLYYLHRAGFKGQLVHISMGMLPYEEMYTLGKAVQAAIETVDKRVAVIASGDLSHRLIPGAPAGYNPRGAEFDQLVIQALKTVDVKSLLAMDKNLIEAAGECGLRPICFLMGVLGGYEVDAQVLSYEGPYGVGYAIALFTMKEGGNDA
jgi:aromatic ring-opening dioxygenase LigB subunit